jgi:hypothetical protein
MSPGEAHRPATMVTRAPDRMVGPNAAVLARRLSYGDLRRGRRAGSALAVVTGEDALHLVAGVGVEVPERLGDEVRVEG